MRTSIRDIISFNDMIENKFEVSLSFKDMCILYDYCTNIGIDKAKGIQIAEILDSCLFRDDISNINLEDIARIMIIQHRDLFKRYKNVEEFDIENIKKITLKAFGAELLNKKLVIQGEYFYFKNHEEVIKWI